MIRKVRQSDIDEFQKATGIRVRQGKKKEVPEKTEVVEHKQEITLSVPDDLLAPIMTAVTKLLESQKQTQSMISEALLRIGMEKELDISVTERDSYGNISRLSLNKPMNH